MAELKKNELIKLFDELSEGYNDSFLKSVLIASGRGGVFAARDYITACAILSELKKAGITDSQRTQLQTRKDCKLILHPTTSFRLNSYTPCLSSRWDELKPEQQETILNSKEWLFTEKMNGVRIWVVHHGGVTKAYSRNYSRVGCELPEYWNNIFQECSDGDTFAFDAEIKYEPDVPLVEIMDKEGITTDSQLEAMTALLAMHSDTALSIQKKYKEQFGKDLIVFRLIAPLFYKGVDYRKRTIGEGFSIENQFIKDIRSRGINLQPIRKISGGKEEKLNFLDTIIDREHGEGVVAHNLKGVYNTSENRSKDVFVKIKRSVGEQAKKAGLGDTIDGYVTGFKLGTEGTANEGLVAALEITTQIKKPNGSTYEHVIAYVPNIPLETKRNITVKDFEGNPTLDPQVYGLVCECSGQNISRVERRLTHPRIIRFPVMDRTKFDCIYSEEFILSQVDDLSSI